MRSTLRPLETGAFAAAALLAICCGGPNPSNRPEPVSLISLIAAPNAFNGRPVAVVGVIKLEFEGTALYFHRTDYDHGLTKNAVWLSLTEQQVSRYKPLQGHYVLVSGTFNGRSSGHFGVFSGTIDDVVSVEDWPSSIPDLPPGVPPIADPASP